MKRAKRVKKEEVVSKRILEYWTPETNELFKKINITIDSNEEGTAPNVDPTQPLLMHIMQCIGSLGEVSRRYKTLIHGDITPENPEGCKGDEKLETSDTQLCYHYSGHLEKSLRLAVGTGLRYPIESDKDKPAAVSFLMMGRGILENVPYVADPEVEDNSYDNGKCSMV